MSIAEAGEPAPPAVRKRPKNRRSQLALAAAEMFCERGYHGVSLDEIATAVGISGPAVYRHFPNKYAMLVHATRQLVETVRTATDLPDEGPAEQRLGILLGVLARLAVEHRRVAGLYQWEWRHLEAGHREEFLAELGTLASRMVVPLRQSRPELTGGDAHALVQAAGSVFGSLGTHRAVIARGRAEAALCRAAQALLWAEPARPPAPVVEPPAPEPVRQVPARREILLAESVKLFHRHGYHAVGMEDIGRAAGINASSIYRYFPSKADILAAAFYRASERVAESTAQALSGAADDTDALHRMIESYVGLTFERSALVSVYLAENNNLPAADRHELRKVQRLHVEEWVRLLGRRRPELAVPEARILVHAALNLATDLSRLVRFDRRSGMDAHLNRLMMTVLMA